MNKSDFVEFVAFQKGTVDILYLLVERGGMIRRVAKMLDSCAKVTAYEVRNMEEVTDRSPEFYGFNSSTFNKWRF